VVESWRIGKVEYWIADGAEFDPLVARGQETAAPQAVVERLVVGIARALRDHGHEGRQVLVLAPQAIREPRPNTWPAGELGTRLEEGDGRIVIDRLRVHRLDEAQFIDDLRGMRQQLTDPGARLTVPCESKAGRSHRKARLGGRHAGQTLATAD